MHESDQPLRRQGRRHRRSRARGPAAALQSFLDAALHLPCTVPAHYEVANAIGAARARLTVQATLYADTVDGQLSIPEISCLEAIPARFAMADAEKTAAAPAPE